ncbi:MAG: ion transporter [Prevotellaceae bacterium]|nr:ion transporter [Prevotellaceae bacterium]
MNKQFKSRSDILRQHIHIMFYGVNTSVGKLFDVILLILTVCSLAVIMLETVESVSMMFHRELLIAEWFFTVIFTVEYILRIYSLNKPLKYIFSFYGIVDLLAILPMYLSFFIIGSNVLSAIRSFRLFRLFRVLRLFSFIEESTRLRIALISSRPKIIVFLYTVVVISFTVGTVMYFVEGPESGFTSIPVSIYWTVITLTTVGYGDIVPHTGVGQFFATMLMITGYGIIAVPTGIVSAEIVKQKRTAGHRWQYKDKTVCHFCHSSGHSDNAVYCFKCGKKLEDSTN